MVWLSVVSFDHVYVTVHSVLYASVQVGDIGKNMTRILWLSRWEFITQVFL